MGRFLCEPILTPTPSPFPVFFSMLPEEAYLLLDMRVFAFVVFGAFFQNPWRSASRVDVVPRESPQPSAGPISSQRLHYIRISFDRTFCIFQSWSAAVRPAPLCRTLSAIYADLAHAAYCLPGPPPIPNRADAIRPGLLSLRPVPITQLTLALLSYLRDRSYPATHPIALPPLEKSSWSCF